MYKRQGLSTWHSPRLTLLPATLSLLVLLVTNASGSRAFAPHNSRNRSKQLNLQSRMKMSSVDKDANAYNQFFSSSIDIKGGYARNGWVTISRSVRDIDNNKRRSFLYHASINDNMSVTLPPIEEATSIKVRIPSPSGEKVALFLRDKDGDKNKMKQVMEIWTDGGATLQRRIVLPTETLHGDVCTDTSWFGGMSWRPGLEDIIVYVAEQQAPATNSFFEKSQATKDTESQETCEKRGGQFTLGLGKKEDWGEKYVDTANLGLFCVSIDTGKVKQLKNVPGFDEKTKGENNNMDTFTLGQPVFSPCGESIVYTAWDAGAGGKMPRKLGSIYCYQRSCFLYSSSVRHLIEQIQKDEEDKADLDNEIQDESFQCLTSDDAFARSARFSYPSSSSTGTSKLAFLCNPKGFSTHGGCMALHTFDWDCDTKSIIPNSRKSLVDEVRLPTYSPEKKDHTDPSSTLLGMSFPGIFTGDLPQECFSPDGSYIYLASMWGSITRVLQISTVTGAVQPVQFNLDEEALSTTSYPIHSSQDIICTSKDGVVVTQKAPNHPGMIGILSPREIFSFCESPIPSRTLCKMTPIASTSFSSLPSSKSTISNIQDSFTWEMIITDSEKENNELPPVQSILLLPKSTTSSDNKHPPLIVVPHGGPHSCSITSYLASYAYLCGHGGYAILLVNYHGSSGFGQDSLEALAGEAGTLDVQDVYEATHQVISSGKVDAQRVGICGGSHGGFLSGHMIGKYPDLYKVAAMRNPVTNIATMVTATDIPDWAYVETFGPDSYDFTKFRGPNKEELSAMWDASPIASVENVKAPTLVALGMMDRRVPPSQGLEYYHTLRSMGVKTKLLVYDKDVHAIDTPVSEADHWVNIKLWFDEHL